MEEAREFKHVCKFCSKSFPCGRSLGGHMRSHMITITDSTEQLARKKLPSVSDTETNGYGLRENPKKSKRNADHSSAITSQQNGKSFVSENKRVSNQDSGASANQKLVTNSQSETETVTPNRKRRSKRRTIRYIASAAAATSNSCSFSVANNNNNNNNNNGYEQEELAMCLMMLSRDVGSRGVLNSVAESSDNNSVFLEPENEVKKLNSSEHNSISKKKIRDSYDLELRSDSLRRSTTTDVSDAVFYKDSQMRSKFECATCNKIFHSYQALGGHRASHKKIKACFGSKIDSSDNSIEAEHSLDRTANSKLIKFINNENSSDHYFAADCDVRNRVDTSYGANKSHECPICLRVFPSGQALGGHKRSHLVGGKEARNNPTIVIENPIPEIRNFLDLNLPAPDEEDSNARLGLQQWWIRRSHKHEALVGLISN